MQYLVSFKVMHHLGEEGSAGCFTVIVFLVSCDGKCFVALPTVPCVGLQSVIVVFSGHTH